MVIESYITTIDASSYFSKHVGYDIWMQLDTSIQDRVLTTASQRIDTQLFIGVPTDDSQSLQ